MTAMAMLSLGDEHTEHALQQRTSTGEGLGVNGGGCIESHGADEHTEHALQQRTSKTVAARPEVQSEPPIAPDAAGKLESNSSPRFSYTHHMSDTVHLQGTSLRREELLEKVLGGEVLGETLVRMDPHAGETGPSQWRRFDELLRDSEAVFSYLGMTLGQLCAAGYGPSANTSEARVPRQPPVPVRSGSASPEDADQGGRRRAMTSIAASLTRQLFAKNFARSDLVSSPLRSAQGNCGANIDQGDGFAACSSAGPSTPSSKNTTVLGITAHTPSIPFMQESNVPSASIETTRGATRLPAAVSGPRIEAFRELSGAGGRKLGYIASAVSSQLAAVSSAAAASATSSTMPAPVKGQSAAAARAALISCSTGLDYSPTTRSEMYVRSGGF